jgi:GNAT superfamily N-acetyltransferase
VLEEKLFEAGSAVPESRVARRGGEIVGLATVAGAYLRLLAVAPAARGAAVGSALLADAERRAAAAGARSLTAFAEAGNYLAPGIAEDDVATRVWLERRGFRILTTHVNLLVDAGAERPLEERVASLSARGYVIARARPEEVETISGWVADRFGQTWEIETRRSFQAPTPGVHLARRAEELVAFAVHDGNNRGLGWFGPAGTLEPHRGRGLATVLLWACLRDIAAAGHRRATIAWIGPRDFYQRAAAVVGERRYTSMTKELP